MVRLVRKYLTVLSVGLVVFRIRLLLRVMSLPRVLNELTPDHLRGDPDKDTLDQMNYYIDRWLQVVPYNRKGNCFPRSLALYWYGWRHGYPVQFHCGVRMGYVKLEGHAWLTLDGEAFREINQQWKTYAITYSYPPDQAGSLPVSQSATTA
jgi:hypothetical protein